MDKAQAAVRASRQELGTLRLTWFTRMWAAAIWFHLAAEARGTLFSQPALAACSAVLAGAAAYAILRPFDRRGLLALGLLVPIHAWLEAPVVGNHWVLAALMSLCVVLACLAPAAPDNNEGGRKQLSPLRQEALLRAIRLTVLTAYSFAAFAKLNWDFVTPAVSCVTPFTERLLGSWGFSDLQLSQYPTLAQALSIATIVIELAVPALLALPRTRRVGTVLGFSFHGLLALDLAQHFWDFSSLLFAGFFLFLDDEQLLWLRGKWQQLRTEGHLERYRPPPAVTALLAAAVALFVALGNILPLNLGYADLLQQATHSVWWLYCATFVLLVTASAGAPRGTATSSAHIFPLPAWLWLAPALAFLNGLTPYLEIKTGFGWNMYSNLRTVGGQSNHMLIPHTWDLTGAQRDLVRIESSSDPNLQQLHDGHYGLVLSEFQEYAHRFPDSSATYIWKGRTYYAAHLGDDPLLSPPINLIGLKLLSFRVVDLEDRERCQPSFSPAR